MINNLKRGFSLMEIMLVLLAVSIIAAASISLISRNSTPVLENAPHGTYRCFGVPDKFIPDNMRAPEGETQRPVYYEDRYNGISATPVKSGYTYECKFKPSATASVFEVDIYGAGAGGYDYSKVSLVSNSDSSSNSDFKASGNIHNISAMSGGLGGFWSDQIIPSSGNDEYQVDHGNARMTVNQILRNLLLHKYITKTALIGNGGEGASIKITGIGDYGGNDIDIVGTYGGRSYPACMCTRITEGSVQDYLDNRYEEDGSVHHFDTDDMTCRTKSYQLGDGTTAYYQWVCRSVDNEYYGGKGGGYIPNGNSGSYKSYYLTAHYPIQSYDFGNDSSNYFGFLVNRLSDAWSNVQYVNEDGKVNNVFNPNASNGGNAYRKSVNAWERADGAFAHDEASISIDDSFYLSDKPYKNKNDSNPLFYIDILLNGQYKYIEENLDKYIYHNSSIKSYAEAYEKYTKEKGPSDTNFKGGNVTGFAQSINEASGLSSSYGTAIGGSIRQEVQAEYLKAFAKMQDQYDENRKNLRQYLWTKNDEDNAFRGDSKGKSGVLPVFKIFEGMANHENKSIEVQFGKTTSDDTFCAATGGLPTDLKLQYNLYAESPLMDVARDADKSILQPDPIHGIPPRFRDGASDCSERIPEMNKTNSWDNPVTDNNYLTPNNYLTKVKSGSTKYYTNTHYIDSPDGFDGGSPQPYETIDETGSDQSPLLTVQSYPKYLAFEYGGHGGRGEHRHFTKTSLGAECSFRISGGGVKMTPDVEVPRDSLKTVIDCRGFQEEVQGGEYNQTIYRFAENSNSAKTSYQNIWQKMLANTDANFQTKIKRYDLTNPVETEYKAGNFLSVFYKNLLEKISGNHQPEFTKHVGVGGVGPVIYDNCYDIAGDVKITVKDVAGNSGETSRTLTRESRDRCIENFSTIATSGSIPDSLITQITSEDDWKKPNSTTELKEYLRKYPAQQGYGGAVIISW